MPYNGLDSVEQTETYKPIKPRKLDFGTIKFWIIFYVVYAVCFWLATKMGYKGLLPLIFLAASMLFVVKNGRLIDTKPSFAIDRVIIAVLFFIFGAWNIYSFESKGKPILLSKIQKQYNLEKNAKDFQLNLKTKNADYILINNKTYKLDIDGDTNINIDLSGDITSLNYILGNEKYKSQTGVVELIKYSGK